MGCLVVGALWLGTAVGGWGDARGFVGYVDRICMIFTLRSVHEGDFCV